MFSRCFIFLLVLSAVLPCPLFANDGGMVASSCTCDHTELLAVLTQCKEYLRVIYETVIYIMIGTGLLWGSVLYISYVQRG